MKSTLLMATVSLSCALVACTSFENAMAEALRVPPSAPPAAQSAGFAPSNVGDKEITIKKPNESIPEMSAYFVGDNTTGNMTRAMAKYTKTGNNTAKIERWDRYGELTVFKLQFTSPHGGKVVGKNMAFTVR